MPRRPIVAVLGGTFDRVHAGHLALLDAAFANAEEVGIGLTTARFLGEHPKPLAGKIRPYLARRRSLDRLLRTRYPGRRYPIVPLDDPLGGSVRPGVDRIVVSEETLAGAREVNRLRRARHLPRVQVLVVPRVVGDDLRPIAGRRIRAGEIDEQGHRRSRLIVRALSNDATLTALARRAVADALGMRSISWQTGRSPNPPPGADLRRTALGRAGRAARSADLGLAIVRRAEGAWYIGAATPEGPIGVARLPRRPDSAGARGIRNLLRAPTGAHRSRS